MQFIYIPSHTAESQSKSIDTVVDDIATSIDGMCVGSQSRISISLTAKHGDGHDHIAKSEYSNLALNWPGKWLKPTVFSYLNFYNFVKNGNPDHSGTFQMSSEDTFGRKSEQMVYDRAVKISKDEYVEPCEGDYARVTMVSFVHSLNNSHLFS